MRALIRASALMFLAPVSLLLRLLRDSAVRLLPTDGKTDDRGGIVSIFGTTLSLGFRGEFADDFVMVEDWMHLIVSRHERVEPWSSP